MPSIQELINGYRRFYGQYFLDKKNPVYKSLIRGQSPSTLFIGCSDSRVDPAILTDANPGDIFVIRNIANLVPKYEPEWSTCHGVSAAIEFAVQILNVSDIVVMGHSCCGGIRSLIDNDFKKNSFIAGWIDIASPVKTAIPDIMKKGECKYSLSEQLAIKLSLKNLLTFPYVSSRVETGTVKLHGWYFSINTGELKIYSQEEDVFEPVRGV
ncbi:carbonic anhydrase [Neorickettsia helminthoeca]|nr:carbonic anhydrase [Neorickettsia helminthoeca]